MKKLQSGRSMVEMLGVLAIIGVLSIGGIAGYTLSMRRYRANNVLDAVAKYSLIAYGNCQQELLNGTFSSISDCNQSSYVDTFSDAGIGDLPAGTTEIKFTTMSDENGISAGEDATMITVNFGKGSDAKKLCQAAASISGANRKSGIQNSCGTADTSDQLLDVVIKQN